MGERWSEERINSWYAARPWIRGCNYLPANCCNRIEQWQSLGWEEHIAAAREELALMSTIGFNSVRIIMDFTVWKQEHDGFLKRLEEFVALADSFGISCMICFGNDCCTPRDENYRPPQLGEQKCEIGYHGGKKFSIHNYAIDSVGFNILDDPDIEQDFYEMVREIITIYRADERIIIWDLFNEPGNGRRGTKSKPYIDNFFKIAREIDPIQPLTSGIWEGFTEIGLHVLELSDIISFHNYNSYMNNIDEIAALKRYNRPIINTEWLNRITDNTIEDIFPLFFLEKIGCYNWGFVAGKSQTYEPWSSLWLRYERKAPGTENYDFSKWQHDLFRPAHKPYDPKEIDIIKKYSALADKMFEEQNK